MRKEIYISDAAADLIDEVQRLANGESLSSVIVAALRNWVGNKRRAEEGFELREIQQGRWPLDGTAPQLSECVGFDGRVVSEGTSPDGALWRIYQTKSRKYVVERSGVCASDDKSSSPGAREVSVGVYDDVDLIWRGMERELNLKTFGDLSVPVPDDVRDAAYRKVRDLEPKWID